MSVIAPEDLKSLSFGYITGVDLFQYSIPQNLISRYQRDPEAFQNGCDQAYAELTSTLSTRYDLTTEFAKTTGRENLLVKIATVFAVRNILGNAEGFSPSTKDQFDWADKMVLEIRNRQRSLKLKLSPLASDTAIIQNNFYTLG